MFSGYIWIVSLDISTKSRFLVLLLLPVVDPLRDPSTVGIDIVIFFTIQFHHNLFVERLAGLFEQDSEDLRIDVLL